VLEHRGEAGLVDEHANEVRIARELWKDALQSDALREPVKSLTARNENLGHAPGRQAAFNAVRAE
jgi:hypothetical protein